MRFESKTKTLLFSCTSHMSADVLFKTEKFDDDDKYVGTIVPKLEKCKRLTPTQSLFQSSEYLDSSALSPKSVESQTSCRSHDGVFLRPDAISTQSSPLSASSSNSPTITALLSQRLIKRTSVDSGINLDLPSFRSAASAWTRSKCHSREFQLMNSSNSITTAASLVTAATAAGIDATSESFSLCK